MVSSPPRPRPSRPRPGAARPVAAGPGSRRRSGRRQGRSALRRRRRRWRAPLLAATLLPLLWLSRGAWWPSPPPPQLILVLGGDAAREDEGARLARLKGLPVVVSGGTNPEYAHWLFQERAGLPAGQVQLDYRAHDTLTNFTSLVDELRQARVRHVLLVTSRDHMDRALLVGRLVAGSRGIHLSPVAVPCGQRCVREGRRKVWGDGLRAALWVVTGRDLRDWAVGRFGPLLGAGFGR